MSFSKTILAIIKAGISCDNMMNPACEIQITTGISKFYISPSIPNLEDRCFTSKIRDKILEAVIQVKNLSGNFPQFLDLLSG